MLINFSVEIGGKKSYCYAEILKFKQFFYFLQHLLDIFMQHICYNLFLLCERFWSNGMLRLEE